MSPNPYIAECVRRLKKATLAKPRKLTYRGSGLPFCPRAFWFDHYYGPFEETQSYVGDLSLFRGTAMHSCLQKWLGQANLLFGNWTCPQCGATVEDHLGCPGTCPVHTKQELVYEEYGVFYKGFRGYADGLIALPKNAGYALLEAKTMKGSNWVDLKEPKPEHVMQANAYAGVLRRTKKLTVCKLWLWYINADKPYFDPKVFELAYQEKQFSQMLDSIDKIRKSIRCRNNKPPVGICTSTQQNPWCIARNICQSQHMLKELGVARKRRTNAGTVKFSKHTDQMDCGVSRACAHSNGARNQQHHH